MAMFWEEGMEEILPCPLCGRDASIDCFMVERGWWSVQIRCDGTNDGTCSTRMTCGGDTKADAVDFAVRSWNTRDS